MPPEAPPNYMALAQSLGSLAGTIGTQVRAGDTMDRAITQQQKRPGPWAQYADHDAGGYDAISGMNSPQELQKYLRERRYNGDFY